MIANDTYQAATDADIPPSQCPLEDLHHCLNRHHFPCTAPASNPLMELAASMAR